MTSSHLNVIIRGQKRMDDFKNSKIFLSDPQISKSRCAGGMPEVFMLRFLRS